MFKALSNSNLVIKLKLIYLVLDGAADRLKDRVTSYLKARKPFLDLLARGGVCGLMYTVGRGVAPESDEAVLSILGYDPHRYYTGRGPIEAVGAGISFKEGLEVAFRANFATVDASTLKIIDRRVGRSLTSEEAEELANSIDGMRLEKYGGYVRVKATIAHRAVVVLGSEERALSPNVENVDPAYRRSGLISVAVKDFKPYVRESIPLDRSEEARITAELVNEFIKRVIKVLDAHPINRRRESEGLLKANAILLRDAGNLLPKTPSVRDKYGLTFGAVTEMPVERGIVKIVGMNSMDMPPPTSNRAKDYRERLEATLKLLEGNDVVYVHLKGPDEPGHDGNLLKKAKAIEDIDKYYVKPLIESVSLDDLGILITSDHATPPSVKAHTDDPVPVVVVGGSLKPDSAIKLTERECWVRGSLGTVSHGWEILPKVLSMLGLQKK